MSTEQNRAHRVEIERLNECVVVRPPCEDLLADVLGYGTIRFADEGARSVARKGRERVYDIQPDGSMVAAAGLFGRIHDVLTAHGLHVQVNDRRSYAASIFASPEPLLSDERPHVQQLLQAVSREPRGLLVGRKINHVAEAIAVIARAFLAERVLVPCATIDETRRYAEAIEQHTGEVVGRVQGGTFLAPHRITCATFQMMTTADVPQDWPVVVYPNAVRATGRLAIEGRSRFGHARIYGFVPSAELPSARDQLNCEMLAGSVIYRGRHRDEATAVEVHVAIGPQGHAPRVRGRQTPAEIKRSQIWNNERRNRAIADIATGFADSRMELLWQHSLLLGEPALDDQRHPRDIVVILVDSVEHARQLGRRLPEWPILMSLPEDRRGELGLSIPVSRMFGLPSRSIMTVLEAERAASFAPDVLIYAMGGFEPVLPRAFKVSGRTASGQRLIIDLDDAGDRRIRRESGCRLDGWRRAGFQLRDWRHASRGSRSARP
jgi:hypothetical protein